MGKKNEPKATRELSPLILRHAMLRRLRRRVSGSGQITYPAVPALVEHYTESLCKVFAGMGRDFNRDETAALRAHLQKHATEGFAASPFSRIVVDYHTDDPPSITLSYTVKTELSTVEDEYEDWTKNRKPPLFGEQPDAKVTILARTLGPPAEAPVLDIGAGTGRNTLPLARAGHPVDAVELAPSLADILEKDAKAENLAVRIFRGDVLKDTLDLPRDRYRMIFLSEVIASHIRDVPSCRTIFERSAEWLAPGGLLVFNAFMAVPAYQPDPIARELSQVMWSVAFTQKDMKTAMEGLPFDPVSDDSAFDFEQMHLPPDQWPPTGWYTEWAQGLDVFDLPADKSPLALRWLVYRKQG